MITGQNTEVRHEDRLFHVQTEDKGRSNPCIESLVYLGGQILASTRTSYAEALAAGQGSDEIAALMERQHRTMIAAVLRGRFDAKVEELRADTDSLDGGEVGRRIPESLSLDEVVLDYLHSREASETLRLSMDSDRDPAAGSEVELVVRASSSLDHSPVDGTRVAVRLIRADRPPQALGECRTGADGVARIPIRIPDFDRTAAALIVTATSDLGKAEIKRLLP